MNTTFLLNLNPIEIINIINNLNSNKATGPYSISNEINPLKMNIADPLSILINISFEKAFYFRNTKISKIVPVKAIYLIAVTIDHYRLLSKYKQNYRKTDV